MRVMGDRYLLLRTHDWDEERDRAARKAALIRSAESR